MQILKKIFQQSIILHLRSCFFHVRSYLSRSRRSRRRKQEGTGGMGGEGYINVFYFPCQTLVQATTCTYHQGERPKYKHLVIITVTFHLEK